jgi:hypothetical protein
VKGAPCDAALWLSVAPSFSGVKFVCIRPTFRAFAVCNGMVCVFISLAAADDKQSQPLELPARRAHRTDGKEKSPTLGLHIASCWAQADISPVGKYSLHDFWSFVNNLLLLLTFCFYLLFLSNVQFSSLLDCMLHYSVKMVWIQAFLNP